MPKPMIDFTPAQVERFWASVDTGDADDCWEWQRVVGKQRYNKYGRFDTPLPRKNGKQRSNEWRAHRVAYYLASGMDPGDKIVCHLCNNPSCCNPAHLELGTDKSNAVYRELSGHGGRRGPGKNNLPPKPRIYQPRFTPTQVDMIRELVASGLTQTAVARRYGINQSVIWKVIHRTDIYRYY